MAPFSEDRSLEELLRGLELEDEEPEDEQPAQPDMGAGWEEMSARIAAFPDFPQADADELFDRYRYFRSSLCRVEPEGESELIFALLLFSCLRADAAADVASLLSRPGYCVWRAEELGGGADLLRLAREADGVGADFAARLKAGELFGDFSMQSLDADFSPLLAEYKDKNGKFFEALEECAERARRSVNTPEECVRLAVEYADATGGEHTVIFKNGTCVTAPEDEPPQEYALRALKESEQDGSVDHLSMEDVNDGGDELTALIQTPELGGMNGVFNHYWESESWWDIDRKIVEAYRAQDIKEPEIVEIVRGE